MKISRTEFAVWCVLAVAGGWLGGASESPRGGVQGPVLLLMIVNFVLTLPGRASAVATALLSVVGLVSYHIGDFNAGLLVALIPAAIAAAGGTFAGMLLDTAASRLGEQSESDLPFHRRPVSRRFMLAVALCGIAAAGVPVVFSSLGAFDLPIGFWVTLIWQILTLLGWIVLAPGLLATSRPNIAAFTPIDALTQFAIVIALSILHAAIIVVATRLLFIRIDAGWAEILRTAYLAYLPLDLLAYLSILTIGFISDVDRQTRDAAQREAALRLTALRARLNPHFLFNVLNSVGVLSRGGRHEESARVIDGLTKLLRYVLDERYPRVPLGEEIDFVREYLEVQRVRFGDRLRFTIDAASQTLNGLVPQLLLQPIVENAVEHGISNSLAGGNVRVSTSRDATSLMIAVEDDGPGIAPDSRAGIGLASTRERLSGMFGDKASLVTEPRAPSGTRVIIRLPYEPAQR
jgi:two-component system LytT family sensor kinase